MVGATSKTILPGCCISAARCASRGCSSLGAKVPFIVNS